MSDIDKWRRRIIPRSKTPTIDAEQRSLDSVSTTRSRPKLSTFLSYSAKTQPASVLDLSSIPDQWHMDKPPAVRNGSEDIRTVAQTVMQAILASTTERLPREHNMPIMRIIEAFNKAENEKHALLEEVGLLQANVQKLIARVLALENAPTGQQGHFAKAAPDSLRLRQTIQDSSNRPRAQTTNSLRGENKQTMAEFLEGSRSESQLARSKFSVPPLLGLR